MTTPFWHNHAQLVEPVVSAEADRLAWLQARRSGLGSSDASVVLGMNRYSSPWLLWRDKTGRTPLDDSTNSEAILWGNLLEPVIRDEMARRLDVRISKPSMMRSIERPWMQCDPDGVVESENAVVEIKNTSAWLGNLWDGEVPDHAELQCAHAMAVTGAERAYVGGLIGGNRLVIATVERNQRLIDILTDAEERFWREHVVADVEPPVDGSDATFDALTASSRGDGPAKVADDPEAVEELAVEYLQATEQEKAAAQRKAEVRNNLLRLLDGARCLVDPANNELVRVQRGVFAGKRFEVAHPEIAAVVRKKVDLLDSAALKREYPEMYQQFQSVSIRIPKKGA